jgi:hypothetical protein
MSKVSLSIVALRMGAAGSRTSENSVPANFGEFAFHDIRE